MMSGRLVSRKLPSLSEEESIKSALKWAVEAEKKNYIENPDRKSEAPDGTFSWEFYRKRLEVKTGFLIEDILLFGLVEKVFSNEVGTGKKLYWGRPTSQPVSQGTRDESLPHASFASSVSTASSGGGNRSKKPYARVHAAGTSSTGENADVHYQTSPRDRADGGCSIQDILARNQLLEKQNALLLKKAACLQKQNAKDSSAIVQLQLALQESKEKEELAIAQAEMLRVQIKELRNILRQPSQVNISNCSIDASFFSSGGRREN